MIMSTGVKPFSIVHRCNIPLLDYSVGIAAGIKNRGCHEASCMQVNGA